MPPVQSYPFPPFFLFTMAMAALNFLQPLSLSLSLSLSLRFTFSLFTHFQMAANLLSFRPIRVGVRASSGHRKPELHHRNGSSPRWWTPLFGWSSEPDYIDSGNSSSSSSSKAHLSAQTENRSEAELGSETKPSRSRFQPGGFTEEKARQLRMMTTGTASFHDVMYHSAIASRLASEFSSRYDM